MAGGPFTDGSGALFIYETESLATAEAIVAADPYQVGGAFASYQLSAWEIVKANPGLISAQPYPDLAEEHTTWSQRIHATPCSTRASRAWRTG